MKWTYEPVKTPKDAVRLLTGDTDSTEPILHDEEIEYVLGLYNNTPINASIRVCELIMAKFSRLADESVGQVKISFSQKVKQYSAMKNELIARLSKEDCEPYAGGISVSDKLTRSQDTDRIQPDFSKHMMENQLISPWVSQNFEDFLLFRF